MIKFPFTTLQQLNLDWIMQQLKKILDFMPMNGSAGDVLQRNVDGAEWTPLAAVSMDIHGLNAVDDIAPADELPIYDASSQINKKVSVAELIAGVESPVTSVNGQTGDVVITIPDSTSDLTNDSGFVTAAQAAAAAPVQSVNGQTGNVVIQAGGAVSSVNGQTGDVVLTIPDSTSDLTNDSGFVTAAQAAAAAPVQSVNGQTGAVVIPTGGSVDMLFGTPVNLTVTAPADTTVPASTLQGQTAGSGKYLRISGIFRVLDSPNNGWKTITLSGITVARPQSEVIVKGIALRFESSGGEVYSNDVACNLRVSTSGVITLDVLVQYSYDSTTYGNFIMLPVVIPLA